MLNVSWLEKIASGNFETELVKLTLTNGYGDRFEGHGQLTWTTKDGVQVDAWTDGIEILFKRYEGRSPCLPRQIIPSEYYLRLEGQTFHQETVVIERIFPNDYTINTAYPTVPWKILQHNVLSEVSITDRNVSIYQSAQTELLLNPVVLSWPRESNTICDNPHFPINSSIHDWLEFDFSGGHVVAKQLKGDLVKVRLDSVAHGDPMASFAVSLAFGFISGRSIKIIAEERRDEQAVTKMIYYPARDRTKNRFSPPLSNDPRMRTECESLLSKATKFFCTDIGRQAGDLLRICHISANSTFTNQALVFCVIFEGLVKLLVPKRQLEKSICTEQKNEIIACLKRIMLDKGTIERFSGFIGKMDEVSSSNNLHVWASNGLMGITRDDVRAWNKLRHPAAHGQLLMDGKNIADKQENIYAMDRVKNLLNKLFLNAMEYEGRYYDYAEYKIKTFTPAKL